MLTHFDADSARAYENVVGRAWASGVVDLHALVTLRLQAFAQHAVTPPPMAACLWALSVLPPACFAAQSVLLTPASRAQEIGPPALGVYYLPTTLAGLLHRIDAFVALATARASAKPDSAPTRQAPPGLSVREQATWAAASHATGWPRVTVDAAFSPPQATHRGHRRAEAVIRMLQRQTTEPGVPVFLSMGSRAMTDLLSPYIRDVGFALTHHAGDALRRQGRVPPESIEPYELADKVLSSEPTLRQERAQAEASVGIAPVEESLGEGELIACQALDIEACDPVVRGVAEQMQAANALVVRLDWDPLAPATEAAALLTTVASQSHWSWAGLALSLPWPPGASPPTRPSPFVFSGWGQGVEPSQEAWPWHAASAGASSVVWWQTLETRALSDALLRVKLRRRAAVLGVTDPQRSGPCARAFAAYASAVWLAADA